jgi:hypothetical protein
MNSIVYEWIHDHRNSEVGTVHCFYLTQQVTKTYRIQQSDCLWMDMIALESCEKLTVS